MADPRRGRQTPTQSVVLPYSETLGKEAIDYYNSTGRVAQEWQELLTYDILAVNEEGLWVHTKYGLSIPRRNGKNEVVAIREIYGLLNGESILHTAHRTTTSSAAAKRLATLLTDMGYIEIQRPKKGVKYSNHFTFTKQMGLECITVLGPGGGSCNFRTRSSKGGLGEGFDLLIIDEAQEYTDDQESALKYVVSDSDNPQTIFCGTPPTPVSTGTVFTKMRNSALMGETVNTGWAEWSVSEQSDIRDKELWYETNPSMGVILTERKITDEIGSDVVDFNIQRLGLWIQYNQKSAISKTEWRELQCEELPKLRGKLFVGIKYSKDSTSVSMSIAAKTTKGKILVETIDCRPVRATNTWIMAFLRSAYIERVVIDGAAGQDLLAKDMKNAKLRKPILPTVKEVISAHTLFEQGLEEQIICHMGQPSLEQSVSNCDKRAIGASGGFGYKSQRDDIDVSILESVVLAYWACKESKEKRIQKISY